MIGFLVSRIEDTRVLKLHMWRSAIQGQNKWKMLMHFSVLFMVCMGVSGCISSGEQTSPKFYVLSAGTGIEYKARGLKQGYKVYLKDVRIPQYLDRPQIISQKGDNELIFAEYHQWGGNLRKNIQRVCIDNLSFLTESDSVYGSPHRPSLEMDVSLEIEVTRFQYNQVSKDIHFQAVCVIEKNVGGSLQTETRRYEVSYPIEGESYSEIVKGMSLCLSEYCVALTELIL